MAGRSAAVLTVSDGVSAGARADLSGTALVELLESEGYTVSAHQTVPDEAPAIREAITALAKEAALVVTTGGTGFGPRDVTPEATRAVLDREAPGLVMVMLLEGIKQNPMAALSRPVAGTCGKALVINLPGSPRGAVENLGALFAILPHALTLLSGDTEHPTPQPSLGGGAGALPLSMGGGPGALPPSMGGGPGALPPENK
jgi:molybdopterin adenylyltransferase